MDDSMLMASGLAAYFIGFQLAIDHLQDKLNAMKAQYLELESGRQPKQRGRPKKSSGWSADPEERSREMKRRLAVAKRKHNSSTVPTHPREVGHPDHEQWLAKMRRGVKRRWRNMPEDERQARIDKMLAAQARNRERAAA